LGGYYQDQPCVDGRFVAFLPLLGLDDLCPPEIMVFFFCWLSSPDSQKRNDKLEEDLLAIILQIIKEANERKSLIPAITPTNSMPDSITPFPYKVPHHWSEFGRVFGLDCLSDC